MNHLAPFLLLHCLWVTFAAQLPSSRIIRSEPPVESIDEDVESIDEEVGEIIPGGLANESGRSLPERRYAPSRYMDVSEGVKLFTDQISRIGLLSAQDPQLIRGGIFNPSIAILPNQLESGAKFIASATHNNDRCGSEKYSGRNKGIPQTAYILDADYKIMAAAKIDLDKGGKKDGRWVVLGDKLYFGNEASLWNVNVTMEKGELKLDWVRSVPVSTSLVGKKHVAAFWNKEDKSIHGMWWDCKKAMNRKSGHPSYDGDCSHEWYGNIDPIELPDQGLYLGLVHKNGRTGHRDTRHRFVIMSNTAPFAVKRVSSEFCFPSLTEPGKCESIQMVRSAIRVNDDLVISYGIQECEAALAKVPMQAVLDLVDSSKLSPYHDNTFLVYHGEMHQVKTRSLAP